MYDATAINVQKIYHDRNRKDGTLHAIVATISHRNLKYAHTVARM